MNKTERQFDLIALLLDTRRSLRAAEIRARFDDYTQQSDEAFKRMFERDKTDIEALGFVIDRTTVDAITEEIGYRITPDKVLLDDPGLTPGEMAALSLAAQAWEGAESEGALLKLSVAGQTGEPGASAFVMPRVETGANVRALVDAIARRKVVRFTYRTGGGGKGKPRTVEPHGLHHRGTWYLTGLDRDRKDVRRFRLSRVDGTVTVGTGRGPDFEPQAPMRDAPSAPWEAEDASVPVRVTFAPDVAWWVERRTHAQRLSEDSTGWVVLEITIADVPSFASWIAGFGDMAEALEPADVRAAVAAHLRGVVEA